MSHFAVLVIGENPEQQLAPYQENNMGDCPSEYMVFKDQTEEYQKEYETETRKEFYCGSNSSWGMEVPQEVFEQLSNLQPGEQLTFQRDKTSGLAHYFTDGKAYRCYYALPGHKRCEGDQWVRANVLSSNHPDPSVCFEGTVLLTKIEAPKEVKLNEFYPTFDEFLKDWHGITEKDEIMGKYGYWYNPNAKWDWYQLGGRYTGLLKLKPGASGSTGKPGLMTSRAKPGFADSARKADIDFEGMRDKAGKEAGELYDKVHEVIKGLPKAKGWDELREEAQEYEAKGVKVDWDQVRDAYHAQPAIKALAKKFQEDQSFYIDSPEEFNVTREEYIEKERKSAGVTFAVVREGKWYQRGEMGWWATVTNEMDYDQWLTAFNNWVDECPDDTLFSIYDLHI